MRLKYYQGYNQEIYDMAFVQEFYLRHHISMQTRYHAHLQQTYNVNPDKLHEIFVSYASKLQDQHMEA